MSTVADLKIGQICRIINIGNEASVRHRLMEMGLTKGTTVRLVRVAPLGDPIELDVRGYRLSIRKSEAMFISVEP